MSIFQNAWILSECVIPLVMRYSRIKYVVSLHHGLLCFGIVKIATIQQVQEVLCIKEVIEKTVTHIFTNIT